MLGKDTVWIYHVSTSAFHLGWNSTFLVSWKISNLLTFLKIPSEKNWVHNETETNFWSFCPRWKTPQYFSSDNFLLCVFQYWRFSLFFPLQESWVISITKVLPCRCPLQWLHLEATTKSEDLNKKRLFCSSDNYLMRCFLFLDFWTVIYFSLLLDYFWVSR